MPSPAEQRESVVSATNTQHTAVTSPCILTERINEVEGIQVAQSDSESEKDGTLPEDDKETLAASIADKQTQLATKIEGLIKDPEQNVEAEQPVEEKDPL